LKNNLFLAVLCFFLDMPLSVCIGGPLDKIGKKEMEKVQSFLSPVAFAKSRLLFSLHSLEGKKKQHLRQVNQPSSFLSCVSQKLPKISKRYGAVESRERQPHQKTLAYKAAERKARVIPDCFSLLKEERQIDWKSYVARHFDNPDVLFSKTRTLFFLQSHQKRSAFTLETLKKKTVFLTLHSSLVRLYGLDIFDDLLNRPHVFFLVTPDFLLEQIDFFQDPERVKRVKGVVSGGAFFEYDSVCDLTAKSRGISYTLENPLSLRYPEFMRLLSQEESIFEYFPDLWECVLGLHFQDASPQFLENSLFKEAFAKCRFLIALSWKFGENIYKDYEKMAVLFRESDPAQNSTFYFYEVSAQKGRKIFMNLFSKMRFLKMLDLSPWFFRKNMDFWCYKSLQSLFLLPDLQSITLPLSLFEDQKFFSTLLAVSEKPLKGKTNFLGNLRSLNVNCESEPIKPAKKMAELTTYQENAPYLHQILFSFDRGMDEAKAKGWKELIFFLTRPWVQAKLTHLSVQWLCFNAQNGLILGDLYSEEIAENRAQGWLRNYSREESFLVDDEEQELGIRKDFYKVSDLIQQAVKVRYQFPWALQGLKKLKSAFWGEVFSYDQAALNDRREKNHGMVSGVEPCGQFTESFFLQSVALGIESWSRALIGLRFFRKLTLKDHSLLDMLFVKSPEFPFNRIEVCIQKSSYRLRSIFQHIASRFSFDRILGVELEKYSKISAHFHWDHLLETLSENDQMTCFVRVKKFVLQNLNEYKNMEQWIKSHPAVQELSLHLKSNFEDLVDKPPPKKLYQELSGKNIELPSYEEDEEYWLKKSEHDFTLRAQNRFLKVLSSAPQFTRFSVFCESDPLLFLLVHSFPDCALAYLKALTPVNFFLKNWLRTKISKEKCPVLFYNDQLI
jgi:hypothetical protein